MTRTAPLVVVGDALLDIDLIGTADRLSPESPVPVVHDADRVVRPGGAALAAALAAGGGREVILISPLCADAAADELRAALAGAVTVIALPAEGATSVKTRLRAGSHPIARLDRGSERVRITGIPGPARAALRAAAAVLVADYGRGCTADPGVRELLAEAAAGRPLVWDPHPNGAPPVAGTLLATPNESELRQASGLTGRAADALGWLPEAARRCREQWGVGWLAVTLGARGAALCDGGVPLLATGRQTAAGDTCGAGDCFAASLTAALADGALPSEAVQFAVQAAGEFVGAGGAVGFARARAEAADRHGTGSATAAEPDLGRQQATSAVELAAAVRASGGTVVATGGCFDLLHSGHVSMLEAARSLGDCLIVCLNSDESVRRLKGSSRPLQSAADRARVLTALSCVDAVLVFEEDTPETVLGTVRPTVWVKGGDYSGIELPESSVLAGWGGVAVTVPYQQGRSTTGLLELARSRTGIEKG